MNHSSLVINFQNNVDFVQMAHLDVPRSCFCCSLPDMAALKVLPVIHTTIVISYSFSSASIMMLRFDDSLVPSFPSSCYSPFPPSFFSASFSQPSSSSSPFSSRRHHRHHHHDSPVLWFQPLWTTKVGPRAKVVVNKIIFFKENDLHP